MENTKNLGLKKWEGEDRILHTEFNDNWDKLDAAIAGRLGPAEIIKTIDIPQAIPCVDIDMGDVDWDQWDMIVLSYENWLNGGDEIYVLLSAKDGKPVSNFGNNAPSHTGFLYIGESFPLFTFFFPLRDKTRKVVSLSVAGTAATGMANIPFSDIQAIQVGGAGNAKLLANTKIHIWGIR